MTVRSAIETFPEPYRTQALNNTDEVRLNRSMGPEFKPARGVLLVAFPWSNSPEGSSYWAEVVMNGFPKNVK